MQETIMVPLDDFLLDPRLEMRESVSDETIEEYAESLMDLPPATGILGESGKIWLTDGWKRYRAHKKAKQEAMKCIVREGTYLDALAEAAGSNNTHGVRRTSADKRRAVLALLGEPLWQERSDRMIANACHVSHPLVSQIRLELATGNSSTHTENHPNGTPTDTEPEEPEKPRCDRCKRIFPRNNASVDGCTRCAELQAPKAKKAAKAKPSTNGKPAKTKPEETKRPEVYDDAGTVVPQHLLKVFEAQALFDQAAALLTKCANAFKAIEQGPTKGKKSLIDKHYRRYFPVFREARKSLVALRPALVCAECGGDGAAKCCGKEGWKSREEVEAKK